MNLKKNQDRKKVRYEGRKKINKQRKRRQRKGVMTSFKEIKEGRERETQRETKKKRNIEREREREREREMERG